MLAPCISWAINCVSRGITSYHFRTNSISFLPFLSAHCNYSHLPSNEGISRNCKITRTHVKRTMHGASLRQIQILRHVLALILRAFTSFALKLALSSLSEQPLKYCRVGYTLWNDSRNDGDLSYSIPTSAGRPKKLHVRYICSRISKKVFILIVYLVFLSHILSFDKNFLLKRSVSIILFTIIRRNQNSQDLFYVWVKYVDVSIAYMNISMRNTIKDFILKRQIFHLLRFLSGKKFIAKMQLQLFENSERRITHPVFYYVQYDLWVCKVLILFSLRPSRAR